MGKSVSTKFLKMLVEINTLVNEGVLHEGNLDDDTVSESRYKVTYYEGETNGTKREYRVTHFDGVPVEIYYSVEGQMSGHLYR